MTDCGVWNVSVLTKCQLCIATWLSRALTAESSYSWTSVLIALAHVVWFNEDGQRFTHMKLTISVSFSVQP